MSARRHSSFRRRPGHGDLSRPPSGKKSSAGSAARDVVKDRVEVGWLGVGGDSRKFYRQTTARLFRSSTVLIDMVKPMIHAHVKKIERGAS